MNTAKLSTKGQIIIPKPLRTAHHWQAGQEFIVVDLDDGILLKPKKTFNQTSISEVASCLQYNGKPKTVDDMNAAIRQAIQHKNP